MVHVIASIVVKPEFAEPAQALLVTLAEKSRDEAGCIGYQLFRRPDQPHVFRTVEQWLSQADVDAHMKTAHVGAAIAAAGPMFAAPPDIVSFVKIA